MIKLCSALLFFAFFITVSNAQSSKKGLVIGEGVRVRSEASPNGKEISKINGLRPVEIIEEGSVWDDLGKGNACEKHKWVKVKWLGDSTGWVYGKYVYLNEKDSNIITPKTYFTYQDVKYHFMLFKNYNYPPADDEGLTGCEWEYLAFMYDRDAKIYYQIKDSYSKEKETFMKLYSNMGMIESVTQLSIESDKLIVYVNIQYQTAKATAVYSLKIKEGLWKVSGYAKAEAIDD